MRLAASAQKKILQMPVLAGLDHILYGRPGKDGNEFEVNHIPSACLACVQRMDSKGLMRRRNAGMPHKCPARV